MATGVDRKVLALAHRAGFTRPEFTGDGLERQNSIPRAKSSLSYPEIDGCEIDVQFTRDGVAVVTHDDISKKSLEEFRYLYPNYATLESWIRWFETEPALHGKKLYLDLKGDDQDPYKLLMLVEGMGDRVLIGSKDASTVAKFLVARDIIHSQAKVYLQIPDPLLPKRAVRYADDIMKLTGLDSALAEYDMQGLRPDGLHFYWPENLLKEIVSEVAGHGQFVPVTDPTRPRGTSRFPNFPGIQNLQSRRLRSFVHEAKSHGYEVVAGSTASPYTIERMREWGVDVVMPNDAYAYAQYERETHQRTELSDIVVPLPGERLAHAYDIYEHDLTEEVASEPERAKYLAIVRDIRQVPSLKKQFGI